MSSIVVYSVFAFGLCACGWALLLQQRVARAQSSALLDPLTGLFNRRGWDELVSRETARARREEREVTLFYLDVDDFKRVNDERGHAAGDNVLREIANAIRSAAREEDVVARLGGDEFAVLAAEGEHDGEAMRSRLLERWASAFAALGIEVSVGTATFRNSDDADTVIRRADEAMYAKKRTKLHHTSRSIANGRPISHVRRSF